MLKKLGYIFSTREKVLMLFLLAMIVAGSFLELGAVAIFSPFIDLTLGNISKDNNKILEILYWLFPRDDDIEFLTVVAITIIIIYVVKNMYTLIEKNIIYRFSYNVQRKISTRLLKSYMTQPYTFHLNKNISVLQRSLQEDTDLFAKGILHAMELVAEVFVCIALAIYLFMVSKSITIIVVGLLIVCVVSFSYISKYYSTNWGCQAQEYKAGIYKSMNQALGGIKEIKVLNCEETFIAEYDNWFGKFVKVCRYSRMIGVMPKYVVEMVCISGLMLAVIFKMYYGQKEFAEFIPQLAVFAVAAFRLLPSVGRINENLSNVNYSLPSIDLVYSDVKEMNDMMNMRGSKNGDLGSNILEQADGKESISGDIYVKNVSYSYPNTDMNVIDNVSFTIPRGKTVAFIGASGAGKTTIIDIILGLLSPQRGKIYANGINVLTNLNMWQKNIGYIPQTIYLSDESIKKNIAFGISEQNIDNEKVKDAIKSAQLDEFIDSLSNGVDTVVGDRGVRLSGGQRQRIGIARALYHNPDILILDEATSALDNDTESAVMEAIDALKGTKTILIIAHRLTTLKNADVIFEVIDGKVEERDKEDVIR